MKKMKRQILQMKRQKKMVERIPDKWYLFLSNIEKSSYLNKIDECS